MSEVDRFEDSGYKTIEFGEHTPAELRAFLKDVPDHAWIQCGNHSETYGTTDLIAYWRDPA